MGLVNLNAAEILLVGRVVQRQVFVQNVGVLLLKNFAILGVGFIAIAVIFAVLCYFINEKQRKRFDAPGKQFLLLLKV